MNKSEQDTYELQLQNDLNAAFEEYLHATGPEKIEAKRRYLEKLRSFSALVLRPCNELSVRHGPQ